MHFENLWFSSLEQKFEDQSNKKIQHWAACNFRNFDRFEHSTYSQDEVNLTS